MKILVLFLCISAAVISVECDQRFCDYSCWDVSEPCALKFHKNCVDPEIIYMDNVLKQAFLDEHNKIRNLIASGNVTGYGPACRMATMQWDPELAAVAEMLGHTCETEHDRCRRTKKFFQPGQNLHDVHAYKKSDVNRTFLLISIKYVVENFYKEIRYSKPSDIDSFPLAYEPIGHFTAMMTESNTHLGCAISSYEGYDKGNTYRYMSFICNYARSQMYGLPVYTKCPVPAQKCTTGVDGKYRNLCSTREQYDVNYYTKYDIWEWDWEKNYL